MCLFLHAASLHPPVTLLIYSCSEGPFYLPIALSTFPCVTPSHTTITSYPSSIDSTLPHAYASTISWYLNARMIMRGTSSLPSDQLVRFVPRCSWESATCSFDSMYPPAGNFQAVAPCEANDGHDEQLVLQPWTNWGRAR